MTYSTNIVQNVVKQRIRVSVTNCFVGYACEERLIVRVFFLTFGCGSAASAWRQKEALTWQNHSKFQLLTQQFARSVVVVISVYHLGQRTVHANYSA